MSMKPLTTASGIPLFRSKPASAARIEPAPVKTPPTGELHLDGTVLTLPDGRFEIRTVYNPEATGFFHSLPESRWLPKQKVWRCLATPLAAWMLRATGLVIDHQCAAMAVQWDEAIEPPTSGSVDISLLKTTPRPHQIAAMEFSAKKPGSMQALDMGCGKTLTAIGLMCHWRSRKVLVLCPKAVLGVWRREMEKHCGIAHHVAVLDSGNGNQKAQQVRDAIRLSERFAISMVVVNYESSWRDPLAESLDCDWDLIILDESHRASDASSRQAMWASHLANRSTRKLLLTGTPMDSPLNLFAQYKIIEPALFGTSYTRFRSRYAVTHEQYKNKVLDLINQDEFIAKYRQLAFRVETNAVWELPELTNTIIPVTLEPKTMREYRTLAKQSLLELEQGIVTAANSGVRLLRLGMMACGHVTTEDGKKIRVGNEKKEALREFLQDIPKDERVVVFARFTEDLRQIEEVAQECGRAYGEVSGCRKDLTPHSTMPERVNVMGVQEQSGGVGIDLTLARYCVYFSHGYSLKTAEQSSRRVYRPGQGRPTFIYHLSSVGTVDEAIMKGLEAKSDIVNEILKHVKWAGAQ